MNMPEGAWEDPKNPIHEKERDDCPYCIGTGKQLFSCCGDSMIHLIKHDQKEYTFKCPTCLDNYESDVEDCEECNGEGKI